MRYLGNSEKSKELRKEEILEAEEFLEVEKRVIRIIQKEAFLDENDEKLKTLKVYKDEDDLIMLRTACKR